MQLMDNQIKESFLCKKRVGYSRYFSKERLKKLITNPVFFYTKKIPYDIMMNRIGRGVMEELDIKDLLLYFLNKSVPFFAIVAFVVTLGCLYSVFLQQPKYTSKTSIILTGFSSNETSSITQSDLTVNSKLVSTYKEIVKSRRVLNQVIENLKLEYGTSELAKMISVGAIKDTEIIEISVTDASAKQAYFIANEVAEVFGKEAKDLYNLSNVSILDSAEIEDYPSNFNISKQVILYVGAGVAVAIFVLFIFYYFDTTIKSVSDVERKFGLTILGSVPDYTKKKKGGKRK